MTVAQECILGAEMTDSDSEASLTKAYGVFAHEACSLKPEYTPDTVNTDGWAATQNAWKHWFPRIAVILCFLHAFIKIRDRATKALMDPFNEAANQVWEGLRSHKQGVVFPATQAPSGMGRETCTQLCNEESYLEFMCQKR